MRKSFLIISLITIVSSFMMLSHSCVRKPQHETSAIFGEALKCYDKALDMFSNDSLNQAFPKFIETLEMIEALPEDMNEDEKHLASRTYCNITRILASRLEINVKADASRKAFYYQKISNDIDTLTFPLACLLYADTFDSETESDSVMYYAKMAIPLIDTVGEYASLYILSQQYLSEAYRHQKKYDSCFYIKRNMIAFSDRHGLDTKGDSLALGIDMFYSSYKLESKPYLMKVFEIEAGDVMVGMVMQLLEQIYEMENNRDSVAFCRSFYKPSFEAEIERINEVDSFLETYNNYAKERDARLEIMRGQKEKQKRNIYIIVSISLLLTAISALIIHSIHNKNKYNKHTEQLNNVIADKDFKFASVDGKIKKMNKELREKEECIKTKEKELNEMKQKMLRIENVIDIDVYYKSEICQKIVNRKPSDFSALSKEELSMLLQAADKYLNNINERIKDKYPEIKKDDLYYICLVLLNIDDYTMQFLLAKSRRTVWNRLNNIRVKMGLEKGDDILMHLMNNFIN